MSLIKSLQNPALYDHSIDQFEVIETHISLVLLTGEYVYKIKKPVNFGFLDFSTLDKRRFYCEEEVRLNRRLAPQLYMGVVSIHGSEAQPVINGQGEIIEYAVKMRQFPQSAQLDRKLVQTGLDNAIIDKLADKVAGFHLSNCVADTGSEYGDVAHVRQPVLENINHIRGNINDSAITSRLNDLEQWCEQQLKLLAPVIGSRKEGGYVRECHGDMHLRNIALWQDEIILFDCIEFNQNFYWIDVMSEIAFLVMDLEDRQQLSLAQRFLNRYLEATGDYTGLQVFTFYKVYRAMVRAKVAALRGAQEAPESEIFEQSRLELTQYLSLAESYTLPAYPCLMINYGLSGSGKTVGTRKLTERVQAIQIRSDVERKRLYKAETQTALYSQQATRRTYAYLEDVARILLQAGYSVIVDAANLKRWQRQLFIELANSLQIKPVILHYSANEATLKQRVANRAHRKDDVSDATVDVLQQQLKSYDPLIDEERAITIEIDTDQSIGVDKIVMQLKKLL